MKKPLLLIPILAAVALFAQPVFAEDAHTHGESVQAAPGGTAGPAEKAIDHVSMMQESMNRMQAQMAAIHQTKDPKKRQKLLQEHRQSMLESIKMMRETMGGMGMGCPMKGGCMMGGNPAGQAGGAASAPPAAQTAEKSTTADKPSTSEGKKVWTCPMHPDVVRDQPGTCPKCGMELVEVDPSGAAPSGQMGGGMMGGGMMGGGMMGGCMKGGCMMGGCMKGDCPMMGHMMGMSDKHMDMMLMLMEQMIEHDEAAMAVRK